MKFFVRGSLGNRGVHIAFAIGIVALLASDPAVAEKSATNQLRTTLTAAGAAMEKRLEVAFSDEGDRYCAEVARSLYLHEHGHNKQDRLDVFEQLEKRTALAICLERLRSTMVQADININKMGAADAIALADVTVAPMEQQNEDVTERAEGAVNFYNLSWGAGFGISYSFDDAIENAEIVDGVVRVTEDRTWRARIVLEFHRYFFPRDPSKQKTRGNGPFAAVSVSGDDFLAGVGTGWMFGWRTPDDKKGAGFSVGVGVMLDNDVKTLGDGFEENQPPPGSETTVRFEKKARWAGIVFFTRTF